MKKLYLIFFLFSSILASAQIKFQRNYNFSYDDQGSAFRQTADSGFLVLGSVRDSNNYQLILLKLDKSGDTQWSKKFPVNGQLLTGSTDMLLHEDAGVLIKYATNSSPGLHLLKLKPDWSIAWNKSYSGTSNVTYSALDTAHSGGYIILGQTDLVNRDIYLLKVNSGGDSVWSKNFGQEPNNDSSAYMIKAISDGYILCGSTKLPLSSILYKLDKNGNRKWTKAFGSQGHDQAYFATELMDGNLLFTGYTTPTINGKRDLVLTKTGPEGNQIWSKVYGSLDDAETGLQIKELPDHDILIAGEVQMQGMYNDNFQLSRSDSAGNLKWSRIYGTAQPDYLGALELCSDGGFAMLGYSLGFNFVADIFLVKTDASGFTGLKEIKNQSFLLFPNPAKDFVNISIEGSQIKSMQIFNLLGEKLDCPLTESNTYQTIDISSLKSGVYFMKLESAAGLSVQKFVKE